MRSLYEEQQLSCAELARRYEVTRVTMAKWLRQAGIEQRPQKVLNPGDDVVRHLYLDEKLSLNQIAERYGTSITSVSRWLKKAGVQARSIREGTMLSGKYGVHSESHRESLRRNAAIARIGITAESHQKQAEAMRGRTAWNKGKPASDETRQKLITQRADPEYRRRMSERMTGPNSPNWKGGVKSESARRLDHADWRRLRKVVYERDAWTCQECGARCLNTSDSRSKPKLKIQAHHILPRRYGGTDALENLVTLCMSCHHSRERAYQPPGLEPA